MAIILQRFFKRIFSTATRSIECPQEPVQIHSSATKRAFVYCLVGNIVEERMDKSQHTIVKGTKHFSPGAKVYCYPPIWGDGYENIKVIGRHRKSSKLVTMIIPSKHITNWRLKTVYDPFVVQQMEKNGGWTNKESHKERIIRMLKSLNSQ